MAKIRNGSEQDIQEEVPEVNEDEQAYAEGHLPTLFYRCPGAHWRKGGTFDYLPVVSVEQAKKAMEEGWYATLEDAISAYDGEKK